MYSSVSYAIPLSAITALKFGASVLTLCIQHSLTECFLLLYSLIQEAAHLTASVNSKRKSAATKWIQKSTHSIVCVLYSNTCLVAKEHAKPPEDRNFSAFKKYSPSVDPCHFVKAHNHNGVPPPSTPNQKKGPFHGPEGNAAVQHKLNPSTKGLIEVPFAWTQDQH